MQIVTCHKNSDFDALASSVACTLLYPGSFALLPNQIKQNVKSFLRLHQDLFRIIPRKGFDLELVESLIVVDTNNWKRLDQLESLEKRELLPLICWDHHMEGVSILSQETHREEIGSTITLLLEEIQKQDIAFSPMHATLFLLGIYDDTGCLSFPSTTVRDVQMTAFLLENGADLHQVSAYLNESVDDSHASIFQEMLGQTEILSINGFSVGISVTEVDSGRTKLANLVDKLKEFKGLDSAFGIFPSAEDKCIVIGRGNPKAVNIGAVMQPLDGGGHPGAGSALVKGKSSVLVYRELLDLIHQSESAEEVAGQMMSSLDRFVVGPEYTMDSAWEELHKRKNVGLLVSQENCVLGSLSEIEFVKAQKANRLKTGVKGFIKPIKVSAEPSMNAYQALDLIQETPHGLLPVVEEGRLLGVLTRADIMLQIYDF